ncbi:hypothetical protein CRP01_30820 [Flavilitoribacter nigricans DSM 23189 = NBRC 102662]|uniref:Uncharacterized protein n=1 Tax=Flavilitoribacter nigricans (strain ATCC 23147 / DSM 23189 / NBRC 102662 / NCIMB 1420 / SS-2) TaxID=1122177 RepID=A0A2D0N302_FLAN2|nr:hypothetical protein CRP01_30820 [Flavilitoribacter nigricans DSM 23189 = NBRC 102662]
MIALIFEPIESLVFDFPTAAANFGEFLDVARGNFNIGYPTIVVGPYSRCIKFFLLKIVGLDILMLPV